MRRNEIEEGYVALTGLEIFRVFAMTGLRPALTYYALSGLYIDARFACDFS